MKAHYRTRNGRISFEIDNPSAKEIFRSISELQDIFEAAEKCECCQGTNIQYRVRTIDENDYYEIICLDCYAALSFGQSRKGGLFPKRKDAEGKPLPNRGWKVWRTQSAESPVTAASSHQPVARNACRT